MILHLICCNISIIQRGTVPSSSPELELALVNSPNGSTFHGVHEGEMVLTEPELLLYQRFFDAFTHWCGVTRVLWQCCQTWYSWQCSVINRKILLIIINIIYHRNLKQHNSCLQMNNRLWWIYLTDLSCLLIWD